MLIVVSNILSLIEYDRICQNITTVNHFPASDDFGVLLAHEPSHVREEEASFGVVWISVRLRELVMSSVVSSPYIDVILIKNPSLDMVILILTMHYTPGRQQFELWQTRDEEAIWL